MTYKTIEGHPIEVGGHYVTRDGTEVVVVNTLDDWLYPVAYCTIRTGNVASIKLFESLGFCRAEQYPADEHEVVLLTRTSPTWNKKCSNPTWKSNSSDIERWMTQEPTFEPSSWECQTPPSPLEDM